MWIIQYKSNLVKIYVLNVEAIIFIVSDIDCNHNQAHR